MKTYFDIHVTREDKSFSVGVAVDGTEYPCDECKAHRNHPEVLVVAVDQGILDAEDVECVDAVTEIDSVEYHRLMAA